jgi:hypothetical protein
MAFLFVLGSALAADIVESDEPLTATAGFERMIALEGVWEGESINVPVGEKMEDGVKSDSKVIYETIANDTSVVATYGKDTQMEMVSLFHLDGPDTLVHTHYCAVGNQPSMEFVPSENANEIVLKFSGGTNMDVDKDGHVHDSTMRFKEDGSIETETIIWNEGKHSHTRYSKLKRLE